MFDIGAAEILLVAIIAIVVIGPKDLPQALRVLGQWIARGRKVSRHFRSGLDAMIREAELADLEKEWAERNAQIMKEHGNSEPMTQLPAGQNADVVIEVEAEQEMPSSQALPEPAAEKSEGEK